MFRYQSVNRTDNVAHLFSYGGRAVEFDPQPGR